MGLKRKLSVALAAVFVLVACSEPQQGAAQSAPAPEVAVVTLATTVLALTTELPGRTTDYRQAEIRPQVSGILQQRLFTEGQQVEAGQLLYKIDAAPYQAALANAKANLASSKALAHNAKLKADRFKGLLGSKAVSQQDYDDAVAMLMQADAAVASSAAAVQTAQINLDYTEITAPISGQIGRSLVTEGALLTANQSQIMATIRQLDPIYVDLNQSSTELLKLKKQLRDTGSDTVSVDLLLDDGSDYAQQGSLQFSEVNVDPGTGMVTLRAVFPNRTGDLLPGMFVRARLHHGSDDNALLVPQAAVSRTPKGQASVMLVNLDNKAEARLIEIGRTVGQSWQVLSGLKAGDKVIVAGLQKIRPGAAVRVVEAPAAGSRQPDCDRITGAVNG
ncbi:efflux RND transporter periplasmic adaptor subunit [Rheinheimera maricola]|uniref:Efflux RND transporter periplasmic adaptor subunit n=1 Tax=Rheinheimera maricola TaxID=2793282 RepID=A0ABS7X8X1_9GAMM|nr:efflux RND transporter periplasmic adaptor subunit [Rheinheimera maricola]MBZ9611639.1 efflux RND transporter periplasmic adaptor subunit [Rheinheimera maricola]